MWMGAGCARGGYKDRRWDNRKSTQRSFPASEGRAGRCAQFSALVSRLRLHADEPLCARADPQGRPRFPGEAGRESEWPFRTLLPRPQSTAHGAPPSFAHTQIFNSLHFTVAGLQGGISPIREASIQMHKFAAQTADLCDSPKLPFSSLPLWLSLGIRFWQGLVSSFGAPFLHLLFGIVVREPKCTYGAQRCSSMLLTPVYDIPLRAYTKSCYSSCEHSTHFRSIFFIFCAVSYMY
ncbi:hypothetical protein B0H16DRAFT_1625884 [Mycena metata]|uniref:Uncharacterized protein n=1 Tax=Mycena metata TaxID=1033252 RepID=A0AAD7H532_9AGAR|nr:hypothetical protein B0H16DRAFT_1625884 [Mycena metata]